MRNDKIPRTELERFLARAMHYRQIGQTAEARRVLIALGSVLRDDPDSQTVADVVDSLVEELDTAPENNQRELLTRTLDRIAQLREAGKETEANRLKASLRELYRDDPDALAALNRP